MDRTESLQKELSLINESYQQLLKTRETIYWRESERKELRKIAINLLDQMDRISELMMKQ